MVIKYAKSRTHKNINYKVGYSYKNTRVETKPILKIKLIKMNPLVNRLLTLNSLNS